MNYYKKILAYAGWLLIHLFFGLVLAIVGTELVFSDISIFSSFFEEDKSILSIFQKLAILVFSLSGAIIAFLFFLPIHIYLIKPKFTLKQKRMSFSILLSFVLVIISGIFNLLFYYLDKKNIVDFSFLFT